MHIKGDLRTFVQDQLNERASPFFLKRVLTLIEESNDKKSLLEASDKVGRMIALFIDTALAERVAVTLRQKIDGNGRSSAADKTG